MGARHDEHRFWEIAEKLRDETNSYDVMFVFRNLPDDDGLWSGLVVGFDDTKSARKALSLLEEPGALGDGHSGSPLHLGGTVRWADESLKWVQKLSRPQYNVAN